MGDPVLLILDEVTSGLDPVGRRDLRNILRDCKSRGKTVFFSSHELSEVAKLCDRIILIDRGKLIQEKSLEEIQKYRRKYILKIEVDGVLPQLPDGVQMRKYGEKLYELETGVKAIQRSMLQELSLSNIKILDVETTEASLEEYFVEVVGNKVS